ncbi:MAG: hypothetical protein ABWX96_02035 [Propionibacteriaceae bacterium]
MDERAAPEGMGPSPTGPGFAPWQQSVPPADSDQHPAAVRPTISVQQDFAPRKSRLPALVTACAVLLVAAVVLSATWVAERNDARVTAPSVPRAPARTAVPLREDSIEISSSGGSGRLVIVDHTWTTAGREAPRTGTTLDVEVELICTSGEISFDPYFFQAFDQSGRLFEVMAPVAPNSLSTGTLGPDERVAGTVSFDMPRGQVTLLMTDETTQSVTALKIPD